jgi:ABC-2 type transport system permease protein
MEYNGVMIPFADEIRMHILTFMERLDLLDQAIKAGELEAHTDQLKALTEKIDDLQGTIGIFVNLPPEVIVSPFHADYSNQRGTAYSLMVYYTPRVLALLIQHLAITLGAFALVRERQTGAMEMFRVTPMNIPQLMLGKTLAYTIYVVLASLALGLLMQVLNVPILGSAFLLMLLILLLALASIGIGLLISSISSSDSQAIQLTMIVLLLSVFFTGFFLPLEGLHIYCPTHKHCPSNDPRSDWSSEFNAGRSFPECRHLVVFDYHHPGHIYSCTGNYSSFEPRYPNLNSIVIV